MTEKQYRKHGLKLRIKACELAAQVMATAAAARSKVVGAAAHRSNRRTGAGLSVN